MDLNKEAIKAFTESVELQHYFHYAKFNRLLHFSYLADRFRLLDITIESIQEVDARSKEHKIFLDAICLLILLSGKKTPLPKLDR